MTSKQSAGILLFRRRDEGPEVFLVHPGGPFWVRKDDGAWSIPKGECDGSAELIEVARREFTEETGHPIAGEFVPLRSVRQAGGKIVHAWAVEGDIEAADIRSNSFSMEWPPKSGIQREFPEIDRAAWFPLEAAHKKILSAQRDLLDQLRDMLADR